jgi:hypothetical protein
MTIHKIPSIIMPPVRFPPYREHNAYSLQTLTDLFKEITVY